MDGRPADLRRALRAARLQFAALGMLAGTWGAHIPSVKRAHGLDEAGLSVLLLAAALGCVGSLWFAGRAVERVGTRRAATAAAAAMGATLALVLVLPGFAAPVAAALVLGAGMALFDVCINSEGALLERLGGRAVMSQLHGMWSLGAMAGALVASALLAAGVAPRLQLAVLAAGLAALMSLAARGMLGAPAGAGPARSHFAWPNRWLLVIGLLVFAGMTAEGAMYDWSVLYLAQELGMAQSQAALGYATFCAAMAASRFAGDALRERFSEARLLRAGAMLAAVSMAVVLLAHSPWVALPGIALVGAGLAPVAPILYNAATRLPGASPAAAIASVTSIGYLGFLVGPPLIGMIAHATSLTLALAVVVVAALGLALGARHVPHAA